MLEVSCDLPGDETTPEPPAERFLPVDRDGDARYSVHERRGVPRKQGGTVDYRCLYPTPERQGWDFFCPLYHKEELYHV